VEDVINAIERASEEAVSFGRLAADEAISVICSDLIECHQKRRLASEPRKWSTSM
jgi:hypothetical protein